MITLTATFATLDEALRTARVIRESIDPRWLKVSDDAQEW